MNIRCTMSVFIQLYYGQHYYAHEYNVLCTYYTIQMEPVFHYIRAGVGGRNMLMEYGCKSWNGITSLSFVLQLVRGET